jgi:endo-1,4-beta-D-glucanase Y
VKTLFTIKANAVHLAYLLAALTAPGCAPIVRPSPDAGEAGTNTPAPPDGAADAKSSIEDGMVDTARHDASDALSDVAGERMTDVGPTPPRPGVNFPFPQNRRSPHCIYPSNFSNDDVRAAYAKWKTTTVTSNGARGHLRVQRVNPDPPFPENSTVSEGIAYGMLLAVYMDDQPLFDGLWKYEQSFLDDNGLMNWEIDATGTQILGGGGAATDADEDMAFALVMADRQWGGKGSLNDTYLNYGKTQIDKIWKHEILEGKLVKPGDHWGDWNTVNISYFAPAYYRVFAQVTGNAGWNNVITTCYDTMDNALNDANGNKTNGLVPAWCTSRGVPNNGANYQYDSCRTPFRIAQDYCYFGEPRAKAYVAKTSTFFSQIGAYAIVDGYALNGTPQPARSGQSAAFVGPAGVGAMSDAAYQSFVDQTYTNVATLNLLVGGTYYELSWTALSLLMMTGNFLDYTAYK